MNIPVYTREEIMNAIKQEGLGENAYRFKTPNCIYIFVDAMEKDEIWENLPTSLTGIECADYDTTRLEMVRYFLLEGYSKQGKESIEWQLTHNN